MTAVPYYPACSGCGHHASGIVADTCTAFVPYPDGDPRGIAGYCEHRCTSDPAVQAWLAGEPAVSVVPCPVITGPLASYCRYCHAAVGRPCRVGYSGRDASRPHKARRDAYRDWLVAAHADPALDVLPWPATPCGFCGWMPQRHRMIDAIAGMLTAGEDAETVAYEYDVPSGQVAVVASWMTRWPGAWL